MGESEPLVDAFRKTAEEWLAAGRVGEIEFAGHTYQVQVVDPKGDEYWPFLQFGATEELQDAFCSCETAEKEGSCPHLATALLRLYQGQATPLHVRYRDSLWNRLCTLFAQRQGYEATVLSKQKGGHYELLAVSQKLLFSVEGHDARAVARLEALIEKRIPETEENSLKFSGLSTEELARWREGQPSSELRYELSFWADLAKWLFLLQHSDASYRIEFESCAAGLPNQLRATFDEIAVTFYLSQANLPHVIPGFATVQSPLKVYHASEEALGPITYDRETGCLHISEHESRETKRRLNREEWHQQHDHVRVGGWAFSPGDGFYSLEDHDLVIEPVVPLERLGFFLTEHGPTIARHLVGEQIHHSALPVQHEISVDEEWNLHLKPYLLSPGDLQRGSSRLLDGWAYLEDDGFYPLVGIAPTTIDRVVSSQEVSNFVHGHRLFLNDQKGFETHLSPVEVPLRYEVHEDGTLEFSSGLEFAQEEEGGHDFGDWVYLPAHGFYAKQRGKPLAAVRAGTRIPLQEIPLFIRINREELELIAGFFSEASPVAAVKLAITLTAEHQLSITPVFDLRPEYRDKAVRFLNEYTYVEAEGFAEIPRPLLPPERFRDVTVLKGQELYLFLSYELEHLKPYLKELDPRLRTPENLQLVVSQATKLEGRGVMALELAYQSEHGIATLTELWRSRSQGQRYLFSHAGLIDVGAERFDWMRAIHPARMDHRQNRLRLTTLELVRLQAAEGLQCAPDAVEAAELMESLASFTVPEPASLEGLQSELRHYQRIGLEWLWFLHSHALSGLLCDDMGLGKTHQAMALLAAVRNRFRTHPPEEQPHYLVVCPTSVLYHWREKLAQFLPALRVHLFHGPARSLGSLASYDLLLTSYGVLRIEQARLSPIPFEIAVFDEIQVAKNPKSRTYHALSQLRTFMRVGLTGTPIENNLRELKSLFDLVLPGYLPSEAQFRKAFVQPIEKERDEERRRRLRRIIRPFVLRRKKEEVLTELPEKSEELAHCELSAEQRSLYHDALNRSREALVHDLQDPAKTVSYVHIFGVLTALKRICDHPAVYLKQPENFRQHSSGKWDLFCELLGQARDSDQKVVVFSQYLDMLDIIELSLRQSGIGYAAIRGATRDREEQLKRFATDPHCSVFVGSLQAAGLGIDLTAASVVIHYDRWWTKARESQATDRVYRLGQTRGVQVFKLLTIGTLEERIESLISQKGELLEEVIGSDDAGQLKSFSRLELIELLSDIN